MILYYLARIEVDVRRMLAALHATSWNVAIGIPLRQESLGSCSIYPSEISRLRVPTSSQDIPCIIRNDIPASLFSGRSL
jgi:hypothetical protein